MADPLADERNRVTTHPWLGGALVRPEEAAKMPVVVDTNLHRDKKQVFSSFRLNTRK
jgi:hypothetical protein